MMLPDRVVFTDRALDLLRQLRAQHGELIFHLSGGCCEGSAPMCFRAADFRVGQQDVLLGVIDGCPFYVAAAHFRYVARCQLCIDVVDGGGDSFSLEAVDGVRFIARSRLFDDAQAAALAAAEPPPVRPPAKDFRCDLASTGADRDGTKRWRRRRFGSGARDPSRTPPVSDRGRHRRGDRCRRRG